MRKKQLLKYYPLALKLDKRSVLVVGGGIVAERKVCSLIESGAKIHVISPKATPALRKLAKRKKIRWINRCVRNSDIAGAHIIVAATNNESINKKVSGWARRHRAWVNVVDSPKLSDFISPAVFRIAKSVITVYTDGKDPVLSRDLKNFLKEQWNDFLSYRNRL